MPRSLTLADGQLGVTAATLFLGADGPAEYVNVVLANQSQQNDITVTLTFRRAGGTGRRLAKIVLDKDEQIVLTNLPMQPDDSLVGLANYAASIDYLISTGQGGPLRMVTIAASGAIKANTVGSQEMSGTINLDKATALETLLEEQNNLLRRVVLGLEIISGANIPELIVA